MKPLAEEDLLARTLLNDQMSHEVFDRLARRYDDWYDGRLGRVIFEIEAGCMERMSSDVKGAELEVGVGTGRFAQRLSFSIGLDPSIEVLRIARKRDVEVVRGAGEKLPFEDEMFGGVFLLITLCFLEDPLRVLRECGRVLSADGLLFLGLVLRESPWGSFYEEKGMRGHPFYSRAHFYSMTEVEEMLSQADFKIDNILSALYGKPGEIPVSRQLHEGFDPDAGFVCIRARKRPSRQAVPAK